MDFLIFFSVCFLTFTVSEMDTKTKDIVKRILLFHLSHQGTPNSTAIFCSSDTHRGFPGGTVLKNAPANAGDERDAALIPGWRDPWSRKWQPTPVFLPGTLHGQSSLAGYSPWGHEESDRTERLHCHSHDPCYEGECVTGARF